MCKNFKIWVYERKNRVWFAYTWVLHRYVDASVAGALCCESGDGDVDDFQQISCRKRALSSKHLIHTAWNTPMLHTHIKHVKALTTPLHLAGIAAQIRELEWSGIMNSKKWSNYVVCAVNDITNIRHITHTEESERKITHRLVSALDIMWFENKLFFVS